jgi:hypothetical protein
MYFYVWPVIHIIIIITIIIINALLFLYLFRKRHALRINIFDLNCVFWLYLEFLSGTFFSPRRIKRIIIINLHRRRYEVCLVLSIVYQNWICSTSFAISLQCKIPRKYFQWQLTCSMEKNTIDMTEANSRFSAFFY